MVFRRSVSFKRRSFSSRFRGRPLAHKQRFWVQRTTSVAEVNGAVTPLPILEYADWPIPSGPWMATITVKRALLLLSSTGDDTQVSRIYGVHQDDATDIIAASAFLWDPSNATAANVRVPQKVFRWGALIVPPAVTVGATGSGAVSPGFYTNRDGVRDVKLATRVKSDEALCLNISPGVTGNLVTWTLLSRVLVEVG